MRFAEYELDTDSGELRNGDICVQLPEQPLQVLLLLLSRSGQLVTREELRVALWPGRTYSDFEDNLNHAVRRLREALADSPENPRFIQTVPRRGYRFICPVRGAGEVGAEGPPPAERLLRRGPIIALSAGAIAFVLVLMLAASVAGLRGRLMRKLASPRIESLAVLPVKDFSSNPSQESFADGMTDSLTAGLAQIGALKVTSRTSAMHYKGTSETVPQIARELGVQGIVEASVIRSGNHVRFTIQLIDGRQDRHLWARSYEREMEDALALQSEVVQGIADQIRIPVTPQETSRVTMTRRVDPDVLDATFKGRALLDYPTREEDFRRAIQQFQTAVDRDPTYAPAWAGLSEALWSMATWGFEFVDPAEVRAKAIAAADRALVLDENLPEAHLARAIVAVDGEWDIANALPHFEKAIELRPSYATAHTFYGHILGGEPLLRFDEGRRHLDRSCELDPLSPWNDISLLAWWLFQGKPEKALEVGQRAYQLHPTIWVVPWQTGFARLALEQPDEAAHLFETAIKLLQPERPAVALAPLGLAYGLAGHRADALKILAELQEASKQRYVSPVYIAVVHSGLGQRDEAFRLLDEALKQRTPWLVICVRYDPLTHALRHDPRWKPFIDRLRQRVRLPAGSPDPYS